MRLVAARYGTGMFEPFDTMHLFNDYHAAHDWGDLQANDCLVVWGGADISPSLYKHKVSSRTGTHKEPSSRDKYEWALMNRAKELGLPIIGICRGAQMLCALAGGFLIQDVNNHGRSHRATTKEGIEFTVSSLHHQMMYPFDVEHDLLAWSTEPQSNYYLGQDELLDVKVEPEAVWFPTVRGLAIQWHPEFMDAAADATKYIQTKLRELL